MGILDRGGIARRGFQAPLTVRFWYFAWRVHPVWNCR